MNIKEYKVDIANIKVNPKYQRPLNETWVRKLVKNYDETKVNQLVLSAQPDGTYYVIDGQHTVEATRRAKGEHVLLPAKIFFNLAEQEEADLFYTYNTERKPLKAADKIRARYAKGDPDVVAYFDALDYTGINYSLSSGGGDGVTLRNHSQPLNAFCNVSASSATRAMIICKDAKHSHNPKVLAAVMWLIEKHGEIDDVRLAGKLSSTSLAELTKISYEIAISHGYSSGSVQGGYRGAEKNLSTSIRIMSKAIAYVYNNKLRYKIDLATI